MSEPITLQDALVKFRGDLKEQLGREPVCVELGAGQNPEPGFTGVDIMPGSDIEADLFTMPFPFDDDSVDFIYSSHFVEHVPDWDAFWSEVYRVISPKGIVVAMTPYHSSVRAWQDPDHKQAISEQRYAYLSKRLREEMKTNHYGCKANFEMFLKPWFNWHKDFADKSEAARLYAKEHYINAVEDMVVFLRAVKE